MKNYELPAINKTILDFNRQCAQEKSNPDSKPTRRYEKRIQNYGICMSAMVGEGTFSKVYKGRGLLDGSEVAVKIVELRKIKQMGIEDIFWEELNIIKKLKHPNVVSCIEYFRTANNCYSIYELCDHDLSKQLKKGHLGDKEDINSANLIISDVFQGLLYLESKGIVHRDIKAANVLLSQGRAKIGDFGFATQCTGTFKDVSIGSPAYMAPEGLLHHIYGPKTDVWAFGMLIYEILHGKTPFFNCESEGELRQRVEVPVSWDQLKGSLPSPLKRLILRCLKVDYEQRPTFSQLVNDQYMQRITQQTISNSSRHISKSNYTNQTSDSESVRVREKVSRSPTLKRLEDEAGESRNKCLKSQPSEEGQHAMSMQLQTVNLLDFIDFTKTGPEIDKVEALPEVISIKQLSVEKYLILLEELKLESINCFMMVSAIFKQMVSSLTVVFQSAQFSNFTRFANQFLLQVYIKAQLIDHPLTSQLEADLRNPSSMEFLKIDEDMAATINFIDRQLFALIKKVEDVMDREDIDSQGEGESRKKHLARSGNLIILSLQLIYNMQDDELIRHWVNNYQCKLDEAQQFYIWLYELQLKRMDLPSKQ